MPIMPLVSNKTKRPEPATLVGIQVPGVYTRRFIEYLTDSQLTRLSFWLLTQKAGLNSAHRLNQVQQEVDRRGLKLPAHWQKLPFDNNAQRAEWELWAARRNAAESKPSKKRATKK